MILTFLRAMCSVITRNTVKISTFRAVEDGGNLCTKRTYYNSDSDDNSNGSSSDSSDSSE